MPFLQRGSDGFLSLDLSSRPSAAGEAAPSIVSAPGIAAEPGQAKVHGLDDAVCVLLVVLVGMVLFFRLRARSGEGRTPTGDRGSDPIGIGADEDERRRAFLAKYGGGSRMTS